MNQNPEIPAQTDITEKRTAVEQELRLAKEYWLRIQSRIAGRILRGVEFFVAQRAHWHLQEAVKKAGEWNHSCDVTADGPRLQVSVDVDLSAENYRRPEVPKMLFADNVKPEILAAIAAPLVNKGKKVVAPAEAICNAHELLMAAERYIGTLPEKTEGTESLIADSDTAFSTVTFAEIEASNSENSGQLPLLPPMGQKKKGKTKQELAELAEKPLSKTAIKNAVKHFLDERTPRMSQEQYEREQEAINDCLKNNRISLEDLCTMRWERFKKNSQDQQNRAIAREAKKAEAKTKAPKTKLPKSAASSPSAAGKRQK